MSRYDKEAISATNHLSLMAERGLIIADHDRAEHYLRNISYFRLSAYMRPFYLPDEEVHCFADGTSFDDILDLYVFDRELRLLLLDAIERIEVALRSELTNTLGMHYGAHGYLDSSIFDDRYDYGRLIKTLKREMSGHDAEAFIHHYQKKYSAAPNLPPVWMAMELLTFSSVSILFSQLKHRQDTQKFESHFGFKFTVLRSWFRSLSYLRNKCAHHMRVWNREFGVSPVIPKRPANDWPHVPVFVSVPEQADQEIRVQSRLYMQVVIIEALMRIICPESEWGNRLTTLIEKNPKVSLPHMGFPQGWRNDPFWEG